MRTSQIWWHQFYILSIQMTWNRHWHIFNPNDIRGDVRTIQNNSIEYYTITASLLHIVWVAWNIIWVGQTPSRHLFNPITTTSGARTIPNNFLMVKVGIGCHLFILNTIHCLGCPKYYLSRTDTESAHIQPDYHNKWCPNHSKRFSNGQNRNRMPFIHVKYYPLSRWPKILF